MNGNHGSLSLQLQEANGAVNVLGSHIATAHRPHLDGVVERTNETTNGIDNAVHSDSASSVEQVIEFGVDNVKASCVPLLKILDEVAKIHPFVSVAALAFKTVINLEMTRRDNDRRVLALHAEMCNMMSIVAMLRHFPEGYAVDGETIGIRLSSRMGKIAEEIKTCAASCDTFQNKSLIIRVLTSLQWESKLSDFARTFESQKEELHKDLLMLSSFELKKANKTLAAVHQKVDSMELNFDVLRSPEERRLLKFVEDNGGAQSVWQDEGLRQELDMLSEKWGADKEDRLISRVASLWDEIGDDLRVELETLFRESQDIFERKFQLQYMRLQELTKVLQLDGSETLIHDRELREFWVDMGWYAKRRVKANKMVTELLKFCNERTVTPATAGTPGSVSWTTTSFPVERQDSWSANYLSPARMQGLLEALDMDGSSSVTISELNSFSAMRPDHWSLQRWLAYWTIGTQLAMKSYYDRIRELLANMRVLSADALPLNRAYVQKLLGEGVFYACDCLLSGIYNTVDATPFDQTVFDMFKDHEVAEEEMLREALASVNYELDAPNTLGLVIGVRRLDKSILPLLYLLLEQCLALVKLSTTEALERRRVYALRQSLWTLLRTSYRRIDAMKDMLSFDNDVDAEKYLSTFAFGLYHYVYSYDELAMSEYIQSRHHSEFFTPGSKYTDRSMAADTTREVPPTSPGVTGSLWTYKNVEEVVTSADHPMHPFVQLCVEQGVMAPDGYPSNMFTIMAHEAVAKAARRDELAFEEIFQANSRKPRRQDSLRPVRAMSVSEIQKLKNLYADDPQKLQFYCLVTDNIVRRQIIHSPVMCDKCKKRTINMTRLLCLGCQEEDGNLKDGKTTDYCAKCLFEDLQLDCAAALLHTSYHAFLQIRQFTFNKWIHNIVQHARDTAHKQAKIHSRLDAEADRKEAKGALKGMGSSRPPCHICGYVVEMPFWCCLECIDECYICQNCNLAQEKQINLLVLEDIWTRGETFTEGFEFHPEDKHHWSHSLVLVVSIALRKLPPSRERRRVLLVSPTLTSSPTFLDSPRSLTTEPTEYLEQEGLSAKLAHYPPMYTPAVPGVTMPPLQAVGQSFSPWQIPLPVSPPNTAARNDSLSSLNTPSRQHSWNSLPPGFIPGVISFSPSFQSMAMPPMTSGGWTVTPQQSPPSFLTPHGEPRRMDPISENMIGEPVIPSFTPPSVPRERDSRLRPPSRPPVHEAVSDAIDYPQSAHTTPPLDGTPFVRLSTLPQNVGANDSKRATLAQPQPLPGTPLEMATQRRKPSDVPSYTSSPVTHPPPPFDPPRGSVQGMPQPPFVHPSGTALSASFPPPFIPPKHVNPSPHMGNMGTPVVVPPPNGVWPGHGSPWQFMPSSQRAPPPVTPPWGGSMGPTPSSLPPVPPPPPGPPPVSSSYTEMLHPRDTLGALAEFRKLDERLTTMETSIVKRVSQRVSSRLHDHSEDLEDGILDLQQKIRRIEDLIQKAEQTVASSSQNKTEDIMDEEHSLENSITVLMKDIESRVRVLEEKLAALDVDGLRVAEMSDLSGGNADREQHTVLTTAQEEGTKTEVQNKENSSPSLIPPEDSQFGGNVSQPNRRTSLWRRAKARLR